MPHDVMGPVPPRPLRPPQPPPPTVPWPSYRWDENGRGIGDGPGSDDETVVMPKITDPRLDKLVLIKDALDLVSELWPKPGYASVTLETHQWVKLRRVLLAIPDLVANDE